MLQYEEYINPKWLKLVMIVLQEQSETLKKWLRVIKPAGLQKYPREMGRLFGGGG